MFCIILVAFGPFIILLTSEDSYFGFILNNLNFVLDYYPGWYYITAQFVVFFIGIVTAFYLIERYQKVIPPIPSTKEITTKDLQPTSEPENEGFFGIFGYFGLVNLGLFMITVYVFL